VSVGYYKKNRGHVTLGLLHDPTAQKKFSRYISVRENAPRAGARYILADIATKKVILPRKFTLRQAARREVILGG
jgi:hypothetical protein